LAFLFRHYILDASALLSPLPFAALRECDDFLPDVLYRRGLNKPMTLQALVWEEDHHHKL
jgi:hypothetical protein